MATNRKTNDAPDQPTAVKRPIQFRRDDLVRVLEVLLELPWEGFDDDISDALQRFSDVLLTAGVRTRDTEIRLRQAAAGKASR